MSCRRELIGILIVCGCFHAIVLAVPTTSAAESPSGLALLRGVESVRKCSVPLKMTFRLQYISPSPPDTIECVVECDGQRRRFEQHPTGIAPGDVIIMDGSEFHGFTRKEGEDVCVYDMRYAVGTRGDRSFDPRVLGLSDSMTADTTIKGCMQYENIRDIKVIGKEEINGAMAWRVRTVVDYPEHKFSAEHNFWIEEPSFRLHRRTSKWTDTSVDIVSQYDTNDASAPLPKSVHIKRVEPGYDLELKITVTSLEWPTAIPAERFTLKSMNLPKNTMINDYRIKRIVGYWNGEGVSKDPVYAAELPSDKPFQGPAEAGRRWVLIVCGTLLIVLIVVFVGRRYRRSHA